MTIKFTPPTPARSYPWPKEAIHCDECDTLLTELNAKTALLSDIFEHVRAQTDLLGSPFLGDDLTNRLNEFFQER